MCCMYIHSGKTFMHIKITPPKFNFFNFLKILRFLLLPMIYIKISIFSISLLALVIFKKFLRLYFNYISTFPLFPPNLPPMSLPSLLQIHGLFFLKKSIVITYVYVYTYVFLKITWVHIMLLTCMSSGLTIWNWTTSCCTLPYIKI